MNHPSWKPWYDKLKKPSWTPTPKTIGTIWTILYPIIAISFGFVFWKTLDGSLPFQVALPFIINLIANLLFFPIQFKLKNLLLATIDIIIVWFTIHWSLAVIFKYYKLIALAQFPYLMWVSIAMGLQISIFWQNRKHR